MWQTIKIVTSGLALVAFIWAGAVAVLRARIQQREKLILAAGEKDRPALIQQELENYYPDVEVRKLPLRSQSQIALERMRSDLKRFQIKALVVSFLAILFTGIAIFAISKTPMHPAPFQGDLSGTQEAAEMDTDTSPPQKKPGGTHRPEEDPCNVPLDQRPIECPI